MELSRLAVSVESVRPESSLADAAHLMIRDAIHALLVTEGKDGPLVGILTDRDVVRQVAEGSDPATTNVEACMSRPVTTITDGASPSEITAKMRVHGIRHIPLVDRSGTVTGVVSLEDLLIDFGQQIGDIAAALRAEFQHEVEKTDPTR